MDWLKAYIYIDIYIYIGCYWGCCLCSLFGRFLVRFSPWSINKTQQIFCISVCEWCLLSSVSWSDYRELGEKQIEGSGAVHPHPPHEHPGQCGGDHCHPSGCQPVSHPPDIRLGIISLIVIWNFSSSVKETLHNKNIGLRHIQFKSTVAPKLCLL